MVRPGYLRVQNLPTFRTRELSRLVRPFMDLKPLGVKERFAANVAYAVRIVFIQVSSQSPKHVELSLTYMAAVRADIQLEIGYALTVYHFVVDLAKMAAHLADICQIQMTVAAFQI
jgi:hypothetical protein